MKIKENIYRLEIPFSDVYTTVYIVKTDEGVLLFDTGTYESDVDNYILPFIEELGIAKDQVKYVFISHNHGDHSGGLKRLMEEIPKATIIAKSDKLKEQYLIYNVLVPKDGEVVLNHFQVIHIKGHSSDSCAIYDTRTKTLITGDCLQLYGLYGSGKWGANISYIKEHLDAIDKLKKMDIKCILTAHNYHPLGYLYEGENIEKAYDNCIAPLNEIKNLVLENPELNDEEICGIYNSKGTPVIGTHVVTAVRGNM